MDRERHSCNHESPSYKVHNHPHTCGHIYINIYIYTHTHTSCTMLSHREGKVRQTLPTFQGYGPVRYMKCKTYITIPRERGPSKKAGKVKSIGKGGTLIHALVKRLRKREGKRKPFEEVKPPNLLNVSLCGLASSCLHPYPFLLAPRKSHPCSKCPCSKCVHAMTKETIQ